MYWDRFDIAEAWYLALENCHGGQFSDEYKRLCNMRTYFNPKPNLRVGTLTDNGREIYEAACERMLS